MEDIKLGQFIRPFYIGGITFFIRGLSVGEHTDLLMSGEMKRVTNKTWFKIAYTGIVGWEGVLDEEDNKVAYSREVLDSMEIMSGEVDDNSFEEMIVQIGQEVYYSLTLPEEEEIDKFVASIRFLYFRSEEKNKSISESFDCQKCLKSGMARSRPCGRFTSSEIDRYHKELNSLPLESKSNSVDEVKTPMANVRNKYKASSSAKKPKTEEQVAKKRTGAMVLDGFQYKECPVSYIDDWISALSGVLYHCAKSNLSFFSGGIVDQSYKLYQLQKVVSGESSKIESEEMDKIHNKGKK